MKKLLAISIISLAALVGCGSPQDDLCLKSKDCAGEEDPAAKCAEEKADRDADEQACQDVTCKAEDEALAICVNENGACEEIEGDPPVFAFGFETFGDQCKDAFEAFASCFEDC